MRVSRRGPLGTAGAATPRARTPLRPRHHRERGLTTKGWSRSAPTAAARKSIGRAGRAVLAELPSRQAYIRRGLSEPPRGTARDPPDPPRALFDWSAMTPRSRDEPCGNREPRTHHAITYGPWSARSSAELGLIVGALFATRSPCRARRLLTAAEEAAGAPRVLPPLPPGEATVCDTLLADPASVPAARLNPLAPRTWSTPSVARGRIRRPTAHHRERGGPGHASWPAAVSSTGCAC